MIVPTLDYRLAAQFGEIEDPVLALLLYSIVGGTPAYRDGVARGRGPRSVADLDHWVAENVLSRFSPLFREARYLLAEGPGIRDNAVCQSVLAAVAAGNSTRGGIASYLERKATDISHHLSVLEDAGLLARDVDVFRWVSVWVPVDEAGVQQQDVPGLEAQPGALAGPLQVGHRDRRLLRQRHAPVDRR